ncbi:hypothetical protein TMEN_2844 [Trichophyton mentagrophytes]|nr:hypothetical protein TMEN_2844 [Trichophyton mentagrophytes]
MLNRPQKKRDRAPEPPQVKRDENNASNLVDVDSPHVSTVPSDFNAQEIKTKTQEARVELEKEQEELKKKYREGKQKAKETAKDVSERAQETAAGGYDKFDRNKSNPVVIGNMVLLTAASAGLAYGAYQKHLRGALTWELVAAWTGGIGALGLFDYYVSRWFFQNKYPPK